MKIRTDFVTNSSSSSFTLEIRFDMKNGKSIVFEDTGGNPEGDRGKYFIFDAVATVSPKQLGTVENVEELIQLLTNGIIDYNKWAEDDDPWKDEEDEPTEPKRKIFEDPESKASSFVRKIKQAAKTMDDIISITIAGKEDQGDAFYYRTYSYDRETGQYTGIQQGKPIVWSEAHCGDLLFSDKNTCQFVVE